jgi:hypothetical protein
MKPSELGATIERVIHSLVICFRVLCDEDALRATRERSGPIYRARRDAGLRKWRLSKAYLDLVDIILIPYSSSSALDTLPSVGALVFQYPQVVCLIDDVLHRVAVATPNMDEWVFELAFLTGSLLFMITILVCLPLVCLYYGRWRGRGLRRQR